MKCQSIVGENSIPTAVGGEIEAVQSQPQPLDTPRRLSESVWVPDI